ncbi:MAG: hypothetical protein HY362_04380 [Candidatus Aenigmarchaeota archaeon]|nr:hypothetical protein [Candidatus Aenigmarchaeota archaeon]
MAPPHVYIEEKNVRDHNRRGRLVALIRSDPGVNFSGLREYMGERGTDGSVKPLPQGSLTYHLDILEEFGLVKSVYRGRERLLYPTGFKVPRNHLRTEEDNRILDILRGVPEVTQSRLAELAEVAQSTMSYRLRRLADYIKVERVGKENRLFAKDVEDDKVI